MRFKMTGNCRWNGEESKNPSMRGGKTKSGIEYHSGGFGVATDSSSAWVEGFGMAAPIKTFDTDNTAIEIAWDDRFDQDIIDSVANYKKYIVSDGNDRKIFLSFYDVISHLNDLDMNGRKVTVTGQTQTNVYQGKVSQRFNIQNIYLVDEEALNTKDKLQVTDILYFNKDSFDTADWNSEHKLTINGWINTFIDKNALGADKGANKYIPFTVVFDCSKIDWNNEKHVKLVKFKLKQIGCDLVDSKIKINLKKNVYKMNVVLTYVNGAEEVEFDPSMLTDTQREAIDLGLKTIDDFKERVFGSRVTMFKLSDYDLRGDYEDGYVDCDFTEDEMDIFVPAKEETLDEAMKSANKVEDDNDTDDSDDDDEDLFD